MKALDISARYIGWNLRVTTPDETIEGELRDLYVETIEEHAMFDPHPRTYPSEVVIWIDDQTLRLRGHEDVAILGRPR